MHSFTASVSWPEGELHSGRRKERLSLLRRRASGSSGGVERRMQSGKALPDPASGRLAVTAKTIDRPNCSGFGVRPKASPCGWWRRPSRFKMLACTGGLAVGRPAMVPRLAVTSTLALAAGHSLGLQSRLDPLGVVSTSPHKPATIGEPGGMDCLSACQSKVLTLNIPPQAPTVGVTGEWQQKRWRPTLLLQRSSADVRAARPESRAGPSPCRRPITAAPPPALGKRRRGRRRR